MTKKTYDPLTQWRGKHTPYWLDKERPEVEVRQQKQIDDLRRASKLVPKEKSGEKVA